MINSTAYYNDFWNEMRGKQAVTDSLYNNRESKTNAYHLPGESNKKYTAVLRKESAVRQLATVVNATRSDSRLWTFDCEGQAEWGDMVNHNKPPEKLFLCHITTLSAIIHCFRIGQIKHLQ